MRGYHEDAVAIVGWTCSCYWYAKTQVEYVYLLLPYHTFLPLCCYPSGNNSWSITSNLRPSYVLCITFRITLQEDTRVSPACHFNSLVKVDGSCTYQLPLTDDDPLLHLPVSSLCARLVLPATTNSSTATTGISNQSPWVFRTTSSA